MNLFTFSSIQRAAYVALLAGAAALSGCGGSDDPAALAPVDNRVKTELSGFDNPDCMLWETYASANAARSVYSINPLESRLDADGSSYAVSSGPWWNDRNHVSNGDNNLNLIAVGYYEGWLGTDAALSPLSPGKPIDLRNADIALKWRAPTLEMKPESRLVFWVQTRSFDPAMQQVRYVNYALTGQALEPRSGDTSWQQANLKLVTDPSKWSCLGSSPTRTDTYGCARSIDEVLSNFEIDMGFIIVSPAQELADQPSGAVEFKSISMILPPENRSTHDNTVSYLRIASTPSSVCPTRPI